MTRTRPLWLPSLIAALVAVVAATLVVPVGRAASGRQAVPGRAVKEVGGLRQTPGVPVRALGQRGRLPDHPHAQGKPSRCDKDVDMTTTLAGVTPVAAQNNQICTSADIDIYQASTKTYVVQAGGEKAAWIHSDVTSPSAPRRLGTFTWRGGAGKNTYTPDVKTFRQGSKHYIALSLERLAPNGFCGVVIVDVTTPRDPFVETQIYKNDASDFWCDVHNSFVEDVNGQGRYVYLTADARNDMRVIDIANVASLPNPCNIAAGCEVEIGRYRAPTANDDNYVHDVTVIDHGGSAGRRAYLAYWDSGVVVLDAGDVTPGMDPTPIVAPNVIDRAGFKSHHAFASQDGSLVFTQDEFLTQVGDEPVEMWSLDATSSSPTPSYVDGLELGVDVPANPAHNLEINFAIDPDRLYVGWYKLGLQAWDFTPSGFVRSGAQPRTAVQYHQVQTEATDDEYDGAWGVRLENIGGEVHIFQSDRRYGLIVDRAG